MLSKFLTVIAFLLTPSLCFGAGMFGDFEDSWTVNSTGYNDLPSIDRDDGWTIHPDPHGTMEIFKDCTAGLNGGCSSRTDITAFGEDGTFKVYNQYIDDNTEKLPELDANVDRFVWYMTWPSWSTTVHLGPESDDPTINSDPGGKHYYHYYISVLGSPNYWMQFQADLHPQHTNVENDPVYDPETWGYIHGWIRNYIQFRYTPWGDESGQTDWTNNYGPYSVYVDEQEFFDWPYPDNQETVTSIATAYYGDGDFTIYWQNDSNYEANSDGTNRWGYEIRWSTSPITDQTSYNNANVVDDSSEPYWDYCDVHSSSHSAEGHYQASFNISTVSDWDTIYFAIAEVRRNPSDGFDSYAFQIVPFGETQSGTTNGLCGSNDGISLTSLTSGDSNNCSVGTVASFTGTGPWSWSCVADTTDTCSASLFVPSEFATPLRTGTQTLRTGTTIVRTE